MSELSLIGDSDTFCGLNSDCQVYQPDRHSDCSGRDFTLGVYGEGESLEEAGGLHNTTEVTSWSDYLSAACRPEAMCLESSYADGFCFDCDRFSTQRNVDSYCRNADTAFSITLDDLDTLIDDGYLKGASNQDISQGDDNCACLNYCFSTTVESLDLSPEEAYALFNAIGVYDIAYGVQQNECRCFSDCPSVRACSTDPTQCTGGSSTIYHSTVADLNQLV